MATLRILGMVLWLLSSQCNLTFPVHANAVGQDARPQENQPSQQNSAAPESSDQQKTPGQSTAPKAADSPPGSQVSQTDSSQHGSIAKTKTDDESKKSSKTKSKKHRRTPKVGAPAGAEPTKTVVRNGGTAEPTVDLSPGVNQQQASHQLDETNRQLATADANLKKIAGRTLSSSQQDTLKQIKSLMEQSKTAASGGDVQGAYNLAVKANLLSAELSGQ
jgi:hypothetical protein